MWTPETRQQDIERLMQTGLSAEEAEKLLDILDEEIEKEVAAQKSSFSTKSSQTPS